MDYLLLKDNVLKNVHSGTKLIIIMYVNHTNVLKNYVKNVILKIQKNVTNVLKDISYSKIPVLKDVQSVHSKNKIIHAQNVKKIVLNVWMAINVIIVLKDLN